MADGQRDFDPEIDINGLMFIGSGPVFQGQSVPSDNNGPNNDGNLWDIETYNMTPFMGLGPNSLHVTSQPLDGINDNCLSAIAVTVDVPAVPPCCTLVPNLICSEPSGVDDPVTNAPISIFRPEVINVDNITLRDVLECNGVDTQDSTLIVQTVRVTKVTPYIKCEFYLDGVGAGLNTNFDSQLQAAHNPDLDTSVCQIALQQPPGGPSAPFFCACHPYNY